MDYQQLQLALPKPPKLWNCKDVANWLNFIGYPHLTSKFVYATIDGSCLSILVDQDLRDIGVDSNIQRKKILQWIALGLPEYSNYLEKQNSAPPLLESKVDYNENVEECECTNQTVMNRTDQFIPSVVNRRGENDLVGKYQSAKRNSIFGTRNNSNNQQERYNLYQSFSDNLQNNEVVADRSPSGYNLPSFGASLKVRRIRDESGPMREEAKEISGTVTIGKEASCSFQVGSGEKCKVSAWIVAKDGGYYLQDRGSQSGTFVYLSQKTLVKQGMILEMGSHEYTISHVQPLGDGMPFFMHSISVELTVTIKSAQSQFQFRLKKNESVMNFGRSSVANLAHDTKLSPVHATWSFEDDGLVLQDQHSENGTWLRLSVPGAQSLNFPLSSQRIFRICGTVFLLE